MTLSSLSPSFVTLLTGPVAWSLYLLALALIARTTTEKLYIQRLEKQYRNRHRAACRAAINGVLIIGLLALWIDQLQTLLLSLTAVMVALVIATKELIMCAGGAALRIGGHLFRVGDRIEIHGLRGEVIDHGLFSTTLQELPPVGSGHRGTGRTFVLPNSVFLLDAVKLEPTPRRYAPHGFALTLHPSVSVRAALDAVQEIVADATMRDAERAERFHRLVSARAGCEDCGPTPSIAVRTNERGGAVLHVNLYCLVEEASNLETAITFAFLEEMERNAMGEHSSDRLTRTADALRRHAAGATYVDEEMAASERGSFRAA
ncbi:mechanosensitive ion channel family protein [Notoacmeibacter ruber]|uniref:mechanosensitive ion channel family protein n=1 Tax=Notoacmeibacter ruber TaxID=2670375 RepID=UPI0013143ED0|nr:mechanosensitive ion channel family protein [Notoacmeibacter ruber]